MNTVVRFRSLDQIRHEAAAEAAPRRTVRRMELSVTDPTLAQTDDLLRRRIAEELDFAWRQLNSLCNAIARDGIMAARHGSALPTLDGVGKVLGQLAAVLRSSSPDLAIDRMPGTELRDRLQRNGSVR